MPRRRLSLSPVPAWPTVPTRTRVTGRPSGGVGIEHYTAKATSIPIPNGVALGTIASNGTATLQVGPAGLGTVWFPASAVVSTTSGITDTSTVQVFVGPSGIPTTLQGTAYPGGAATIALAIPSMSPGLYVLAIWTGGHAGDQCSLNVTGTQNALTRPA